MFKWMSHGFEICKHSSTDCWLKCRQLYSISRAFSRYESADLSFFVRLKMQAKLLYVTARYRSPSSVKASAFLSNSSATAQFSKSLVDGAVVTFLEERHGQYVAHDGCLATCANSRLVPFPKGLFLQLNDFLKLFERLKVLFCVFQI